MGSENAKAVAKEVMKTLRKSTKVNMGKILKGKGYSDSVSKHPDQVVNTQSYQNEILPLVKQLEAERAAVIKQLKVTRNDAKYRDLIDGLDKLTKNIQLIQGKATANVALPISILGNKNVLSAHNSDTEDTETPQED